MNNYLFLLFVFLCSVPIDSMSQSLTLEKAIQIAQVDGPDAVAVRATRKAAFYENRAFQASLLPNISLTGSAPGFLRSINPITQNDGSIRYIRQQQSTISNSLVVQQPLRFTGGRVELSSGLERIFIFDDFTGNWNYFWQSTPMVVSYIQPLFQFNDIGWQYSIQPIENELAQQTFIEEMENIAISTTERFFQAYLAKMNMENAQFNVAVNDSIYRISTGRYNVGSIAENDLLQSELALINAQTNLMETELSYRQALADLKISLGLPKTSQVTIEDPSILTDISINEDKAIGMALKNGSFLNQTRLQELSAEQSLEQAKAANGFNMNLTASFGLNQTSEDLTGVYENLENRTFFSVGFNVPIFNWGKETAEINQARENVKATKEQTRLSRNRFENEITFRVKRFELQQRQLQISAKSDTIAQRRYDLTRKRYLIGKVDITNLLIAQNEKDAARRQFIQALRQFWISWHELRQITLYDFLENRPISYNW